MEPDADGNINCTNCTGCTNCENCTDCTNCDYCFECTDCTSCNNCYNCSEYCEYCEGCDWCTACTRCYDCFECDNCVDCIDCYNLFSCSFCDNHGYGYYSKGISFGEHSDHCYYIRDDYDGINECNNIISIQNLTMDGTILHFGNNMIGFVYTGGADVGPVFDLSDLAGYCSSYIYSVTEVFINDPINLKPSIEFTSNSISMFTATLPTGLSINKTTGVISGTYNLSESYSTNVTIQTTSEFGGRQYTTPLTFIYNENRNLNCINCIGCSNCVDCIDCTNCNNCYNCSNCYHCSYFDTCENCFGGGEYAVNCKNCIISGNNVIYVQNITTQEVASNTCSSNLYSIQRVFQTQRVNINPNCVYTSNTQIIFSATENIEYLDVTSNGNISGDINFFNDLNTDILVTYQGLTYSVPLKFNIVEPDENGNVNCINCTNCQRCWDCIECNGCADCKNCNNCNSCWECMNLQSCSYYDNCVNCSNGDHCVDCIYCDSCNSCVYLKGSSANIIQSKTGEFGDLSVNLGEIYSSECVLFDKDLKYTSNNSSIYKYGQWDQYGQYCNTFIFNPTINKYITVEYNGISKQYPINVTYKETFDTDYNGNVNCTDCIDCAYCTDCTGCVNCVGCIGCTYCNECSECNDCINCSKSIKLNKCNNVSLSICCSNSKNFDYGILCKYIDGDGWSYIYDCYNVKITQDNTLSWKGPKVSLDFDDIGFEYIDQIYEGFGIPSSIYNVFDLNKNKYVNIHPSYNSNDIIYLNNLLIQYSNYLFDMGGFDLQVYDISIDVSNNNLNINNVGIISYLTNYTNPVNTEEINITINDKTYYSGSTPLTIYLPDESNNLHCISCYNCQNCYKCNSCSYCMNVSNSDYMVDCTNCNNCNTCIYLNDLTNVTNSIGSGIYTLQNGYIMNSPVNIPPNFEFTSGDNIVFTGDFNNGLSINQTSGIITGNIQNSSETNYVNIKYNNQTFTVDLDFNVQKIYECYLLNNAFSYKT